MQFGVRGGDLDGGQRNLTLAYQIDEQTPSPFIEDRVAIITLNRPDRLNAYTQVMAGELREAFAQADADEGVHAIVLTGAGRGFCAGADMERLSSAVAGATDLLLKPFRAPELRARLKLADDQRRLIQQLRAQGRQIQTSSEEVIDGLQKELQEARQTVARLAEVVARSDRTL